MTSCSTTGLTGTAARSLLSLMCGMPTPTSSTWSSSASSCRQKVPSSQQCSWTLFISTGQPRNNILRTLRDTTWLKTFKYLVAKQYVFRAVYSHSKHDFCMLGKCTRTCTVCSFVIQIRWSSGCGGDYGGVRPLLLCGYLDVSCHISNNQNRWKVRIKLSSECYEKT